MMVNTIPTPERHLMVSSLQSSRYSDDPNQSDESELKCSRKGEGDSMNLAKDQSAICPNQQERGE